MKLRLIIIFSFLGLANAYGQKFETSVQLNAGAYGYSGSSATASSYFIENGTSDYYTNNIYGNRVGFSYGAALQTQYAAKGGFIAGLQAGYDLLRSNETIYEIRPVSYLYDDYTSVNFTYNTIPVKGRAALQSQSINLNPYLGYRIKLHKLRLDLMPGADIAFNTSAYDKGKATDDQNKNYSTNLKLANAPADFRLKLGAALGYKKWSITASYAHGLTNLDRYTDFTAYNGTTFIAHSNLFKWGIGYLLK